MNTDSYKPSTPPRAVVSRKVALAHNDLEFVSSLEIPMDFNGRLRGLIGRAELEPGQGMLISKCSIVHMWFMKFPIDVIFCSNGGTVLGLQRNLKPWWFSKFVFGSSYVIELPSGTIENYSINKGDQLKFTLGSSSTTQ
jgi:hypothetical protein